MGCNTSQEQKNAVAENGDVDGVNETNGDKKSARNSAKSEKSSKSAKSAKLTNGHAEKGDEKSEGKLFNVLTIKLNSFDSLKTKNKKFSNLNRNELACKKLATMDYFSFA